MKTISLKLLILCPLVLLLFLGCGKEEKDGASYQILSVQDFSHGQVGKFSAKVYIKKDLTKDTMIGIIRDVTSKIRKDNNADIVWLAVYQSKIPTFNTLIATTQWINKGLKEELRPFAERSPVSVLLENSPVYITWKQDS